MEARSRWFDGWVAIALVACVLGGSSGCGYLKNLRDDAADCFMFGAGVVVPVVPTEEGTRAIGFLPPSIGAYVEITEFCHLGALYKYSGDLEWDRRGMGVVVDQRGKVGLGPFHYVQINQQPVWVNAYKCEGNQMDGWREHMRGLTDPVSARPAKELIFDSDLGQPFLYRGWQDWETISVEIAVPEPFILHSGFNVRAGFDPSQVLDLLLGVFTIDMYDDSAFELSGGLRFAPAESAR